MKLATFGALAVLSAVGAVPATAATPIAPGTYVCKAGNTRLMLTLGQMRISGTRFTFEAPTGPGTSGSYALTENGYKWTGDIGAIINDQIVESGPDRSPGTFWFKYRARPTSSPTTASCRLT
jgi:hypothetical protein